LNFNQFSIYHEILNLFSLFFIKIFMVDIIMQLDILVRLTLQATTIICHHMKKVLLKKRKKERKYKNMGD